jgi:hypothetical protein
MSLPDVQGSMIDYRTADAIFLSQNNLRIAHCISLCQDGRLYICHHEEQLFKKNGSLKLPFIEDNSCIFEPDDDVYGKCHAMTANSHGKPRLAGNDAAIFIAATAAAKDFGVISDHQSPRFHTVHDFCTAYGVPIYTADQYFALI